MEWLRWVFLAAGVLALAGIVWAYLRHKSEQAVELGSGRTEANLEDPIDVRIRAQEEAQEDARSGIADIPLDSVTDESVEEGVIGRVKVKERIEPVITPATEPFEVEPEPLRWKQPTFTRTGAPEQIDVDETLGLADTEGVIGQVRRKVLDDVPETTASLFRRRQTPHFSYQEKQNHAAAERASSTEADDRVADADQGAESQVENQAGSKINHDDAAPVVLPLLVASKDGAAFDGARVESLIEEIGFEYGAFSIYHYADELGEPLFSLMNGVQPGSFDRGNSASYATPVLALFMQLPLNTPSESLILDQMIDIARDIADQLGGEVLDDQRQPLSSESIDRYREQLNN